MRGGAFIGRAACALVLAIGTVAAPAAANASVGNFALAVQKDGRILLAGGSGRIGGAASGREFGALARYLPDGSLDRHFGGGDGIAFFRKLQPFTAVAVQANGRIVVTSPLGGDGGMARLLPNGRLDASFGIGGVINPGATTAFYPTKVAVSGDGTIFVGGMTGYLGDPGEHWYGRLYRISADGDNGDWVGSMTSGDGRPGEPKTFLNDFVFGPGGSVFGAGTSAMRQPEARSQAALAQLVPGPHSAGLIPAGPNPSFGGGAGLLSSNFFPDSPASEAANALGWDRRRLLLAGEADERLMLARYSRDGVLDGRFGRGGAVFRKIRESSVANALAVPSRGGILVAGSDSYACGGAGECKGLLLARFRVGGRLDGRFGVGGIVSPRVDTHAYGSPTAEVAHEVAGGAQGRVLVGGLLTGPGSSQFFLRRYLADGSPDLTFGDRGRVTTLPLVAGTPPPGSGRRVLDGRG